MIQWISRPLRYFFANPAYSFLYFFGDTGKVIHLATGKSPGEVRGLKNVFESGSSFVEELREKTYEIASEDFEPTADHYFIYALMRLIKPKRVLETGVFDGYFSACFLKGLHDNFEEEGVEGELVSIDLPAFESIKESTNKKARPRLPHGCDPGWVIPDYLRSRWKLHLGDSRVLLPSVLKETGGISFFFHDSLHTYSHMMFEFESAWPFLKAGSFLMSHDVHWNRAFRDFAGKYRKAGFVAHGFGIIKK